jgi:hypothetical protein
MRFYFVAGHGGGYYGSAPELFLHIDVSCQHGSFGRDGNVDGIVFKCGWGDLHVEA